MDSRAGRFARSILVASAIAGCAGNEPPPALSTEGPLPLPVRPAAGVAVEPVFMQTGIASWYGTFHHGRKTASGKRYDMNELTAAHRTLPFGTKATVTNLENGRSVVVVVNDRGPYRRGRIIDLSRRAAERLGLLEKGIGEVRIVVAPESGTPENLEAERSETEALTIGN
ncbi:MAG: septal ring lytic transglycosylase RlpA family protein [Rhodospirillales bacterium]|nr:septal ring lytic transglycosylase RlpA family protein [Rhodospirillales bacterium]